MKQGHYLLLVSTALFFSLSLGAEAAYDAFVKFGSPRHGAVTYVGSSLDEQFPGSNGWSRIITVGHGISKSMVLGSAAAQSRFTEVVLLKKVDSGSPAIFQTCAAGGQYDTAQLAFRQQGPYAPQTPAFYHAKLDTVSIIRIQTSGNRSSSPHEEVALTYLALQWTHRTSSEQQLDEATTAHWSAVSQKGGAGPLPGLDLSPATLAHGLPGQPYHQTFTISGGTSPYFYQLHGGTLPAGLALSRAGELTGTPTYPGQYTFRMAGWDDHACFAERAYTLTIDSACATPPRLLGVVLTQGTLRIRLSGTPGCRYQMERASSTDGPWIEFGSSFGMPGQGIYDVTDAPTVPQQFYRAVGR